MKVTVRTFPTNHSIGHIPLGGFIYPKLFPNKVFIILHNLLES